MNLTIIVDREDALGMVHIPSFAEIIEARHRIRSSVLKTPFIYSEPLSKTVGTEVYLKLDSLQIGGSFKYRGATNALATLTQEERKKGVVAASSGNYGTALALAARRAGVKATIVLPDNAPSVKIERIRKAGATILRHGSHYGESEEKAASLGKEGQVLIHPFDDPRVVAGQGTIALEIDEDAPAELTTALVPVGGGGLISGVALGFQQTRPDIEVIGVEPEAAPSLSRALLAGKPVAITPLPTCADGLSPRFTGNISFEVARDRIGRIALLSEPELMEGVRYCFHELKLVVEPSGAAAVSALIAGKLDVKGLRIVAILSGSNLDRQYFAQVMR